MKRRRRVEITIQRREITTLQSLEMALRGRCAECQSEVNLLPVPLAARGAGVSPRTIYRWVEENRVHFSESSDGTVLICENSLDRK
jgi:hypothetical protein